MNAFDKALALLSRRPYSELDLKKRLSKGKYSAVEINSAIAECVRLNLLNDELFAAEQARNLAERNYGRLKIRTKLGQSGVSEYFDAATDMLESSELERAKVALEYKLRVLSKESDLKKKREKCLRFLLSRGFDLSTSNLAWNEAKALIVSDGK